MIVSPSFVYYKGFMIGYQIICYNLGMENRTDFIKGLMGKATLVAVTKNRSLRQIESLAKDGVTIFGENKVQELLSKYDPSQKWDWHFVGHLQSNKVAKVVAVCKMIQSVDSLKLLDEVEKHAGKFDKTIDILIQVNTLDEKDKFGCKLNEVDQIVTMALTKPHIRLRGFMVMGPTSQIQNETTKAFDLGNRIFESYKKTHPNIDTLSMGMSSDYEVALQHGSNMLRLGSILF
jgi:pyridoxal phosphate enzyme (YggS family)